MSDCVNGVVNDEVGEIWEGRDEEEEEEVGKEEGEGEGEGETGGR